MPIENYFYHGFLYTWHHEPQNLYVERHISIVDCVHVINEDLNPTEQDWFSPSRWKFVGNGRNSVITEDDWLTIVTAWKATRSEQNESYTFNHSNTDH